MNLPDDSPPATAIQNIHDETQTSKPSAEKTNPNNNSNENIELFKNVTAPFTTKNKKQSSISDLVMLTKEKNGGINNNNDHEGKESNGKNTICNRRIEHATTATIQSNRYTTKCTLDIRPEKQNHVINSLEVHQKIFEAIQQMDETAAIITHDNIRITNINTFTNDKEHNTSFPDQRLCKVTKRMYISFTLESTLTLSQLKYGSRYNSTNGII